MPRLKPKQKEKLKKLSRRFLRLYNESRIGTNELTPLNFAEEKKKFLERTRYNPQFIYRKLPVPAIEHELARLRTDVEALSLPQELASYLSDVFDTIEHSILAKKHIGTPDFAYYIKSVYPAQISKRQLFELEKEPISFAQTTGNIMLDAPRMRDYFRAYLSTQPHFSQIVVDIDTFNDHTIHVSTKRLSIGAAVKRFEANVKRLIVHEIESHILQRQNLRLQKNPLLRLRGHFNRELYAEGMAVYNEIASGAITEHTFRTYYLRARAVEMSQRSFREIFTYLKQHMPVSKAYLTTYRVKRGMTDTAAPGGYPKDALYILGYQRVKEYLARGGRLPFLYLVQDPELGELLLKYDLLRVKQYHLPNLSP